MPGRSEVLMIRPEEWEKDGKSRSMDDTHAKIMCYIYYIIHTVFVSSLEWIRRHAGCYIILELAKTSETTCLYALQNPRLVASPPENTAN